MNTALPTSLTLDSLNLHAAERLLCEQALLVENSIVRAAKRLGITRHVCRE